jgi:hypothetical protein
MASIKTVRTDAGTTRLMNDAGPPVDPPVGPTLASSALLAFRAGRSDVERTADLLAFAIATERGYPPTPDAIERARREADAVLGDYSLRYLHNTVEQIRQEAVADHLGRLRPPPGFVRLVTANLVAIAVAGALAWWLGSRPEIRTALEGLLGG